MKVKLIMPPRDFLREAPGLISIPPLGLAHISAQINNNGHEADIDDLDIKVISNIGLYRELESLRRKYTPSDLEAYLLHGRKNQAIEKITSLLLSQFDYNGYDVIGFSFIEASAIDSILMLAKKIKEETGAIIVIGGNCTYPKLSEKYSFIDHIVIGYGESEMLRILGVKRGSVKKSYDFPNEKPDFSGIPVECYKNVPEELDFKNPGKILILPYLWSQGCPYRCSFCIASAGKNDPPSSKPLESTVKELKELSSEFDTRYFFILNSYIELDKEYAYKLSDRLIKENLDLLWCGCLRCNVELPLLPKLSKAGFFYATFGMESASDTILKKMRKGYTSEIAQKAIRAAHEANIWVSLYVITGFPGESDKEFMETFDFIEKNIDCIDQLNVSPYYLINSEIMNHPERFNIKIRERFKANKNLQSGEYAYDEIGGPKWEELKNIKQYRTNKYYRMFYGMHKKIPESFYRGATYQLYHGFDKYRGVSKLYGFLKGEYEKFRKRKTLRIISQSNNKNESTKEEIFDSEERIINEVEKAAKSGFKEIILSGGEPTLRKDLFSILKRIRDKGIEVQLSTNARMLSYRNYCSLLWKYGIRQISVPLYSDKELIHDRETGISGSHKQSVQGIENWKSLGGRIKIIDSILKDNNTSDYIDFILALENVHEM